MKKKKKVNKVGLLVLVAFGILALTFEALWLQEADKNKELNYYCNEVMEQCNDIIELTNKCTDQLSEFTGKEYTRLSPYKICW